MKIKMLITCPLGVIIDKKIEKISNVDASRTLVPFEVEIDEEDIEKEVRDVLLKYIKKVIGVDPEVDETKNFFSVIDNVVSSEGYRCYSVTILNKDIPKDLILDQASLVSERWYFDVSFCNFIQYASVIGLRQELIRRANEVGERFEKNSSLRVSPDNQSETEVLTEKEKEEGVVNE